MTKIYRCKCHDRLYTLCPLCGCQYCPIYWKAGCPRAAWHPAHAPTDEERGRRDRVLEEARQRRAVTPTPTPDPRDSHGERVYTSRHGAED